MASGTTRNFCRSLRVIGWFLTLLPTAGVQVRGSKRSPLGVRKEAPGARLDKNGQGWIAFLRLCGLAVWRIFE